MKSSQLKEVMRFLFLFAIFLLLSGIAISELPGGHCAGDEVGPGTYVTTLECFYFESGRIYDYNCFIGENNILKCCCDKSL